MRILLSQQLLRTQKLFLTGSAPELGEWDPKRAIEMNDFAYPDLIAEVPVLLSHFPFEYKFFVRDETRGPLLWEAGPNRVCDVDRTHLPARVVLREGRFRESVVPQRMAGVAVPVFSLRSQQSLGCGEFRDLAALADWAKVRIIFFLLLFFGGKLTPSSTPACASCSSYPSTIHA